MWFRVESHFQSIFISLQLINLFIYLFIYLFKYNTCTYIYHDIMNIIFFYLVLALKVISVDLYFDSFVYMKARCLLYIYLHVHLKTYCV